VAFSSFFMGTNSRSRIIGIFLALLELLRHHRFRAEQPQDYHEIWILPPLEPAPVAAEPAPIAADKAQSQIESDLAVVGAKDAADAPAADTAIDGPQPATDSLYADGADVDGRD
jgi:segregation and condensation protein A